MKIQLTAKETRKINYALMTIMSATEGVPFIGDHIKSSIYIGQRFTINDDGSSEIEFKEKLVTTFLDSGSEAFVEAGNIIKSSYEKLRGIWKNFESTLNDAEKSLIQNNEGFITAEELEQYRQKDDDGDVLKVVILETDGPHVQQREVSVDSIPMAYRMQTAIKAVKEKQMSMSKASKLFKIPFNELKKHFQ